MRTVTLVVRNKVGLHARPAAVFVRTANAFKSVITVQNLTTGSESVNAKSILMVLTLGVEKDHTILVTANGSDDAEAAAALQELVDSRFGEPE